MRIVISSCLALTLLLALGSCKSKNKSKSPFSIGEKRSGDTLRYHLNGNLSDFRSQEKLYLIKDIVADRGKKILEKRVCIETILHAENFEQHLFISPQYWDSLKKTDHYKELLEVERYLYDSVSVELLDKLWVATFETEKKLSEMEETSFNKTIKDVSFVLTALKFMKTCDKRSERLLSGVNALCQDNPACIPYKREIIAKMFRLCPQVKPLEDWSKVER